MKRSYRTIASLGFAAASAMTASAGIISTPSPDSTVSEIGTRIRWGGSGFEASIFDSDPFAQTPTLNPAGSPVWSPVSGAAHQFRITFDSTTGNLGLDIDFNRSGTFETSESISRSVFVGTTSYLGLGFKYLSISGNESGSTSRSSVENLVINGTSLPSMTPGGLFLENFYKDSSGNLLTTVTITGAIDFTVQGTSQERPSWNFTFRNAEAASVPDAGNTLALLGIALTGLAVWRRKVAA